MEQTGRVDRRLAANETAWLTADGQNGRRNKKRSTLWGTHFYVSAVGFARYPSQRVLRVLQGASTGRRGLDRSLRPGCSVVGKRKKAPEGLEESMVRAKGLEPSRGCPHTDLNRTRLPIPPRPRAFRYIITIQAGFATAFFAFLESRRHPCGDA